MVGAAPTLAKRMLRRFVDSIGSLILVDSIHAVNNHFRVFIEGGKFLIAFLRVIPVDKHPQLRIQADMIDIVVTPLDIV